MLSGMIDCCQACGPEPSKESAGNRACCGTQHAPLEATGLTLEHRQIAHSLAHLCQGRASEIASTMVAALQCRAAPFVAMPAVSTRSRQCAVVKGGALHPRCEREGLSTFGLLSPPPTRPRLPPESHNAASQRVEQPAQQRAANMLLSLAASAALALSAGPATAEVRLPPLDNGELGCWSAVPCGRWSPTRT